MVLYGFIWENDGNIWGYMLYLMVINILKINLYHHFFDEICHLFWGMPHVQTDRND
jgi:hypothetical protein